MNFKQFMENVEIVFAGEHSDLPDGYEDIPDQAWNLIKSSGINILRDKELNSVAVSSGQVVGALFYSWHHGDRPEYSFDVIVDPRFQQQGIGKKLIDVAMGSFRDYPEEDAIIKAEVVNRNLVPLLSRLGFKIWKQEGNVTIMVYEH